jgi:hypothetical protein
MYIMKLFGKQSQNFQHIFHFLSKKSNKNILTSLRFLHHIINFFITIQINKKLTSKQFFFSLFYKIFSNFISQQSLFTTIQINIPLHNYLPNI